MPDPTWLGCSTLRCGIFRYRYSPVGEVLRIVRATAGPTLAGSRLFDEYRGQQVGEGKVSYAIALRFQPETAGDEKAVERAIGRIRGALQHHLGAQIR